MQSSTKTLQNPSYDVAYLNEAFEQSGLSVEAASVNAGVCSRTGYKILKGDGGTTKLDTFIAFVEGIGGDVAVALKPLNPRIRRAVRSAGRSGNRTMQGRSAGGVGRP